MKISPHKIFLCYWMANIKYRSKLLHSEDTFPFQVLFTICIIVCPKFLFFVKWLLNCMIFITRLQSLPRMYDASTISATSKFTWKDPSIHNTMMKLESSLPIQHNCLLSHPIILTSLNHKLPQMNICNKMQHIWTFVRVIYWLSNQGTHDTILVSDEREWRLETKSTWKNKDYVD